MNFKHIARAVVVVVALAASAPPSIAASDMTGTYGGGSCSVWQKIKSAVTGMHCSYL
jgi:hypothetical protein